VPSTSDLLPSRSISCNLSQKAGLGVSPPCQLMLTVIDLGRGVSSAGGVGSGVITGGSTGSGVSRAGGFVTSIGSSIGSSNSIGASIGSTGGSMGSSKSMGSSGCSTGSERSSGGSGVDAGGSVSLITGSKTGSSVSTGKMISRSI